MMQLVLLLNWLFEVVFWIIIVTIFLSWVPNVNWAHPALQFCKKFTEAILEPFRRIIPPINGLDLSPIFALIVLQILRAIVLRLFAIPAMI